MSRPTPTLFTAAATVALVIGCSDPTATPKATTASQAAVPADPNDFVITPAGLYHKSCIHELPDGATEYPDGRVVRRDGSTFQIAKCSPAINGRRSVLGLLRAPSFTSPDVNGWAEWTSAALGYPHRFSKLTANWTVPDLPTKGCGSGLNTNTLFTYFAFPGMENASYILQPVLAYYEPSCLGLTPGLRNAFQIGVWHCNSGSDCSHGANVWISPGDHIRGIVTDSGCTATTCKWTAIIIDSTSHTQSSDSWQDNTYYTTAVEGAVEVYTVRSCNEYPMDGILFHDVTFYDETHSGPILPTWTDATQAGTSPDCGLVPSHGPTLSQLAHNLTTVVSGPSAPNTGSGATYTASGYGPDAHTFQWYRNDSLLAGQTTPTLTFVPVYPGQVRLKLLTHDNLTQWNDTITDNVLANFSVAITGPTNVNYPGGYCTWTASTAGGYGALTYLWTWDGANAGGGSTLPEDLSGQAVGRTHSLSVLVTDTKGIPRSSTRTVRIVSSGGSVCVQ